MEQCIDVSKFNNILQTLSLPDDTRMVYVDGNG